MGSSSTIQATVPTFGPTSFSPMTAAPTGGVSTPGVSGTQPTISAPVVGNTAPVVIPPQASNKDVATFQQSLNSKNAGQPGYTPLNVDGIFGPKTEAASQYQIPTPTTPTTPTDAPTPTTTDPIMQQIQGLISEEGATGGQIDTANANANGEYRDAVLSNVKALTATNAAINDQVDQLEKFQQMNQDNLTDSQKIELQSTLDQQKADAADLTSAKEYAYRAAVKAGDSADVLSKIANATSSGDVYQAIQGTSKYTGTASPTLISIGEQKLQASRGPDGYADPNLYQSAFTDWVNKGFTTESFLKAFPPATYVNPANTSLPNYLMPSKADATTSSSSNTRAL